MDGVLIFIFVEWFSPVAQRGRAAWNSWVSRCGATRGSRSAATKLTAPAAARYTAGARGAPVARRATPPRAAWSRRAAPSPGCAPPKPRCIAPATAPARPSWRAGRRLRGDQQGEAEMAREDAARLPSRHESHQADTPAARARHPTRPAPAVGRSGRSAPRRQRGDQRQRHRERVDPERGARRHLATCESQVAAYTNAV